MSDKDKVKYFWYVIVIAGSAGIWLPTGIILVTGKDLIWSEIPPNLVTYFLSIIVGGSIDYGIKLFGDNSNRRTSQYIDIIIVLSFTIVLVLFAILGYVFGNMPLAFTTSILGVIISLRVWWIANVTPAENPNSALGGPIK